MIPPSSLDSRFGRRGMWVALAVSALIFAGVVGFNRWRRPRPVPPLGPETATIAPGVHMIRGLGPSVAYVVETSDGPVLIDSGLEAEALLLLGEVYLKMHKFPDARESFVVLLRDYPKSPLVVQATNYLSYMKERGV